MRAQAARAATAVLLAVLVLAAAPKQAAAAAADAWRERVIYQLLVDRFNAPGAAGAAPCPDLKQWCGGTLAAASERLGYVSDLGAGAIWVSPVVQQCPGASFGSTGYHGYWAQDLYSVEPHIGTQADLKALVDKAHETGLMVMLDVVGNHMGPCEIATMNPFNSASHYHDCGGCDEHCSIPSAAFSSADERPLEHCRLAGLPDLNQSSPFVRGELLKWAAHMASTYSIDGLRVDTAAMVARPFWRAFADAAGVFTVGEVWFTAPLQVPFVASFAGGGALDSVLSYPMYGALRGVFGERQGMAKLLEIRQAYRAAFAPEQLGLLGVFIDNHDNARFLSYQPDVELYKNALTWVLMSEGIPIIYYGSEQGLAGGGGSGPAGDGAFREPLWPGGFATGGPLYSHIQLLARHRKAQQLWRHPQVDLHAASDCYAFARGATVVVLTNAGAGGGARCEFELPAGGPLPDEGRLVNIFEPQAPDVRMDLGSRRLTLDILNGSPLVLQMRQAGAGAAIAPQGAQAPAPVAAAPAAAPPPAKARGGDGGGAAAGAVATAAALIAVM